MPGEPQTLESCKATVFAFDIPADPGTWTVSVNDEVTIDSTQLDPNLIDKNLIGSLRVNEDGSFEFTGGDSTRRVDQPTGRLRHLPLTAGVGVPSNARWRGAAAARGAPIRA